MGGRVATTSRFANKFLSNSHTALRQEQRRRLQPVDEKQQRQIDSGKQWQKLMELEDASLIAQRPLLDGGGGKLLTNNKTIDIEKEVVPTEETGFADLKPPSLDRTNGVVTGTDTPKHRIKNKRKQKATLATQAATSQWTIYQGEF
jgi:hypothetical protein